MTPDPSHSGPLAEHVRRRFERSSLRPRDAAWLIVVFWVAAVVLFGFIEHHADPETFPTIWLALWWAVQTVTTVGYGDVVPTTPAGRVVGAALMLTGLSLIPTLTSVTVTLLISKRKRVDEERIAQLESQQATVLTQIEQRLARIEQAR